jgi:hypothetical protein
MVDEGGSVPPIKKLVDESSSDSSSNIGGKEESGGKGDSKNESLQSEIPSSQISSNSPFGKGLGKGPFDFEKMSQIYDKRNNVIDLVPGAGLFIDLLKIFFNLFLTKIKKKESSSMTNIIRCLIFRFLLLHQIQQN